MLSSKLIGGALVGLFVLLSSTLTPRTAGAVVRPDAPDLDVTYIERTPRQWRNCSGNGLTASQCAPDAPAPGSYTGWPDPNQPVTYVAHIKNSGTQASSGGSYTWYLDTGSGEQIAGSGTIPASPIAPGAEVVVSYATNWPSSVDQTTHDYPRLRFSIAATADAYTSNNTRLYYILGKSYVFFVPQTRYGLYATTVNGDCVEGSACAPGLFVGTYSYEDWLQRQFSAMNLKMRGSDLDVDGGSRERVNLEHVVVTADVRYAGIPEFEATAQTGSPDLERVNKYDAAWFTETLVTPPESDNSFPYIRKVEFPLLHEMTHQLGAVDIYNIPFANHRLNYMNIPTASCTSGLMGGNADDDCRRATLADDTDYERVHVNAFNRKLAYRAGFYGDFLVDVPQTNIIDVRAAAGQILADAEVTAYQPDGYGTQTDRPNRKLWTLRTDAQGRLTLPNQAISNALTTTTGYALHDSPWGDISIPAYNAWLYLVVTAPDGAVDTVIVDVPWANDFAAHGVQAAVYQLETRITPVSQTTAPPTVSISSAAGAVPWIQQITATASPNTDRVDFYVDGTLRAHDDASPFTFSWDTRFETVALHTVAARAYDLNGVAVSSYALSAPLPMNVAQFGDSAAQPAAHLGAPLAASVSASDGVVTTGTLGLPVIVDGATTGDWTGWFPVDGYIELSLPAPQTISAVKIFTAGNGRCPLFDLYVGSGPPTVNDVPVVISRVTEITHSETYIFAPRVAQYVRYVCRSGGGASFSEIQIIAPGAAPAPATTLTATLQEATATFPAYTAYLWDNVLSAYYFQLCTDVSPSGSFTSCATAGTFGPGGPPFALDALPVGDGTIRYAKTRSCSVFDVCSAPATIFAGVGRSTQAGTDYVYSFDRRTPDSVTVGVSAQSKTAPLRVDVAQSADAQTSDVLGSICVDASGWTRSVSIPAWKLAGTLGVLHSLPASCPGNAAGGFATARQAVVPQLPEPPGGFALSLSPNGARGVDISWGSASSGATYRVCYGATLYSTGATLRCTAPSSAQTAHVNTNDAAAFPQGSGGVNKYYWLQSCDSTNLCGANSRSYGFVGRRSSSGSTMVYDWAFYKNGTDVKFQAANSSFTPGGSIVSLQVFAGADTNAPLLFSDPVCVSPGTTSPLQTLPAGAVTASQLTVRRFRFGGSSCPNNDGTLWNDLVDTRTIRSLPAPPTVDFVFDDTGTSPNVYRMRLDWSDDPSTAWSRYCGGQSATGTSTCSASLWLLKTFQYFNLPSTSATPTYYRAQSCDVERVCSSKSTDYVQMQRGPLSYVWNYTFAYRRTATQVKLQMVNTSMYFTASLWVKLHALDGPAANHQIVAGLDVCSRNNPGQGPISAPATVQRSLFTTNTITLQNHSLGDISAADCVAADTTPTNHANDGDLGTFSGQLDDPSP